MQCVSVLALLLVAADASAAAGWPHADLAGFLLSVALGSVSLFWLTSDPSSAIDTRKRLPRTVARLALLTVSLLVSTLAAEGLARWIYRDVTTTSDFRGYFTTKWLRADVRHNSYGFRDREFSEAKPPGIYRVAVLGDSFAYGNGVPEASRFSNLLDAWLRPRGIEVLNFGFPGNNWPEHISTLERRVLRLRPDFVLLQWGPNDIERDRDVAARPRLPTLIPDSGLHESLHARSALYTLLDAQWIRWQVSRQMGDPYATYLQRLYEDPQSEGSVVAAALTRRFLAMCRAQEVPVGIVLFPDASFPLGADYPLAFLHERLAAFCGDEGLRCVDLLPRFRTVTDHRTLWASPLDPHPGIQANRIAADELLAAFAPRWSAGS